VEDVTIAAMDSQETTKSNKKHKGSYGYYMLLEQYNTVPKLYERAGKTLLLL